ncbi:tetratricopeptide repeat protein, partial [Sphingomonas sp.]|uniref:tetratricopeptide repeat protein n=1 Tax=Sphingomonas sp. TaxID=28214 RepID=UPI0035BBFBC4
MAVPLLMLVTPVAAAERNAAQFDRLAEQASALLVADPSAALVKAQEAREAGRALADGRARGVAEVTVQRLVGEAYVQMERTDEAAPLIASALLRAHRLAPGSKLEADILLAQAAVHERRGNTGAALGEYQRAHLLYQRAAYRKGQVIALLCIASLYGDATDWASALKYLDQALAVHPDEPLLLLSSYNNRASILQELARFAEAEAGYRKALALARAMHSPLLEARIMGNIARALLKRGDVGAAASTVTRALALTRAGDAAAGRPPLVAIAAQVALQRGDLPHAARLIRERFAGVDLATTAIPFREAHQTAYDTYRALGDAPHALEHLVALKR